MMQEISYKAYIICSLLVYLIAGMNYYIFDRSVVSRIFSWTDRWVGDPNNPGPKRGLIYGRTIGTQAIWASIITIVSSVVLWLNGSNLMIEVWTSLFDTTMVLLGFLLGPFAYKIWCGRNVAIGTVDRIHKKAQSGELKKEIIHVAHDVTDGVRDKVSDLADTAGNAVKSVIDDVSDKVVGTRPMGTSDDSVSQTANVGKVSEKKPKPTLTKEELEERRKKDLAGLKGYKL